MDTFHNRKFPLAFWLVGVVLASHAHAGEEPGKKALADDYAQRYPIRVRPQAWAGARIMPDDPDVEGNVVGRPGQLPEELVVVRPGRLPRVVAEDGPIRVLLYYPPESLADVIVKPVVPRKAPAKNAPTKGDRLAIGMPVNRLETRTGFVHIEAGWVPAASIGKMYPRKGDRQGSKSLKSLVGHGHGETHPNRVNIKKGTWLRDGPEGSVVARVKQNNTFFADNRIEQNGWLRLRYYSSWGELGLWLDVSEMAFSEGSLGELLKKGKFFWLDRLQGRTICVPWKVAPGDNKGFSGSIVRQRGEELTYKYEYAVGLVTLTGPVELSSGSFEVLEVLSCGKGCLQVGGERWYFEKSGCEEDRLSGIR